MNYMIRILGIVLSASAYFLIVACSEQSFTSDVERKKSSNGTAKVSDPEVTEQDTASGTEQLEDENPSADVDQNNGSGGEQPNTDLESGSQSGLEIEVDIVRGCTFDMIDQVRGDVLDQFGFGAMAGEIDKPIMDADEVVAYLLDKKSERVVYTSKKSDDVLKQIKAGKLALNMGDIKLGKYSLIVAEGNSSSQLSMFTSQFMEVDIDHTSEAIQVTSQVYMDDGVKGAPPEYCDTASSPLMIDLASDGIRLTSQKDGVGFDLLGDGISRQISWFAGKDDYFLAIDHNNNKKIDGISELFGNRTIGPDGETAANGFKALAKYDGDRNGRIDANDKAFHQIILWNDRNRNSKIDADESKSLAAAGIQWLSLDYKVRLDLDQHGNQFRERSVARTVDGKELPVIDVWFKYRSDVGLLPLRRK